MESYYGFTKRARWVTVALTLQQAGLNEDVVGVIILQYWHLARPLVARYTALQKKRSRSAWKGLPPVVAIGSDSGVWMINKNGEIVDCVCRERVDYLACGVGFGTYSLGSERYSWGCTKHADEPQVKHEDDGEFSPFTGDEWAKGSVVGLYSGDSCRAIVRRVQQKDVVLVHGCVGSVNHGITIIDDVYAIENTAGCITVTTNARCGSGSQVYVCSHKGRMVHCEAQAGCCAFAGERKCVVQEVRESSRKLYGAVIEDWARRFSCRKLDLLCELFFTASNDIPFLLTTRILDVAGNYRKAIVTTTCGVYWVKGRSTSRSRGTHFPVVRLLFAY